MTVVSSPKGVRCLFGLCFLLFCFPLLAREVEITVEDADLEIPLEGALIRSWNGEEFICGEDGKVRLELPDDRQVLIQIAYPGYENRRVTLGPAEEALTVRLRLGGVLEGRELVIEARRPESSETRSGRSVAVSGEALSRTAEIGFIEDVMSSIKLLPGVGYSGLFNALPSIRGGFPGDLTAVLDGFYVENPYHWGGGFSIFDPRMIESAQLSHGVFSARYGHTVSGLLEISSKKASPTDLELEIGVSSSAANLNLSAPLGGRGGVMAMGKLTYWDPFFWAVKQLANSVEELEPARAINTAPYIRSGAVSAYYRFMPELEWTANGFFGSDGIGVLYRNENGLPVDMDDGVVRGETSLRFDWINYQGFLITGLNFNPLAAMVLKATVGAGFRQSDFRADIRDDLSVPYSQDFIDAFGPHLNGQTTYTLANREERMGMTDSANNLQGRLDFDWDLGGGFIFAAGAHELYSQWIQAQSMHGYAEMPSPEQFGGITLYYNRPIHYTLPEQRNQGFSSSAYSLLEYASPGGFFGTELGLRLDHLYFLGKDFSIQTTPVLNPRLNLDFVILKNRGPVDTLSATAGTGLFSSMSDDIMTLGSRDGIDDFEMRPNRSWTSVVGTKIDFTGGFSFNIEGYYKYVFSRAYASTALSPEGDLTDDYRFDGEGNIWGFDLMLQKFDSRYWDGWLSYSFTHARYRDPNSQTALSLYYDGRDAGDTADWYYPSFHRFHNLNLVLNIKPLRQFNIAARLGLASGAPIDEVGEVTWYPVQLFDENNNPTGTYIQKYKRASSYSDTKRSTWSIPLDLKFSWYLFDRRGKVQTEIYIGAENVLSLIYTSQGNTSFNSYTGQYNTGSSASAYDIPIPMVSFGAKWSY
jgi:hypothetical protein